MLYLVCLYGSSVTLKWSIDLGLFDSPWWNREDLLRMLNVAEILRRLADFLFLPPSPTSSFFLSLLLLFLLLPLSYYVWAGDQGDD